MGQGPDLSELRQRVEAVSERFGEMTEDSRRRGERLADLLDEVESGFVRDQLELDRLKQGLAKAQEENAELLALLQRLIGVAEHAGGLGERAALYDLEARAERLYEQTVAPTVSGRGPRDEPEAAARNSGPAGNGAASAAHRAEAGPGGEAEDPRWETVPDDDDDDDGEPLELSRTAIGEPARETLWHTASRTALAEGHAVQDIFKRVSLITGRLRET